jgi:hypothetical protein
MMNPRDDSRNAPPEDRERTYLALICQGLLDEALRAEIEDLLARHSWESDDHRDVFQVLRWWRAEPDAIRGGLPARLTRLGFPDTDIGEYFVPPGVSVETALGWLRDVHGCEPTHDVSGRAPGGRAPRAAKSK